MANYSWGSYLQRANLRTDGNIVWSTYSGDSNGSFPAGIQDAHKICARSEGISEDLLQKAIKIAKRLQEKEERRNSVKEERIHRSVRRKITEDTTVVDRIKL